MPVLLTYKTFPDPFVKDHVEKNFADVASFQGNITDSDISFSAPLAATKLRASDMNTIVQMKFAGGAGIPAASTIMDIVPIPGFPSGSDVWTVDDISWVCTDTGAGDGRIKIAHGYYTAAASLWLEANVTVIDFTIPNSNAGADSPNQGTITIDDADTAPFPANSGGTFRLESVAAGTNYLSAASDYLTISLRLSRVIQDD